MTRHSSRRCRIDGCREIPVFGTVKATLHCEDHAVEGEVNLVERKCASCGLLNIISPTTKKCGYCDPTFKAKRPVKWKELDLKGCLEAAGYTLVHNKRIRDSCGLRDQPDFLIDFGFCFVVVENDEHQHRDRQCPVVCECPPGQVHCKCQQARMIDVGQVLGMPSVWFRYNPDAYKTADGRKGKTGPTKRKQELLRWLRKTRADGPSGLQGFTSAVYLFYDGNDQRTRVLVPIA